MRRIKPDTPDGQPRYHDTLRYNEGDWWESLRGKWYIITSCEPSDAEDEYGDVWPGFAYMLREPTAEELAERERQEAEWQALGPEERTEQRLRDLADFLPQLDWGDQ